MAEIVNLRLARKRKQRETDERAAETNRAKHGRTKLERARDEAVERTRNKLLDGAKRDKE